MRRNSLCSSGRYRKRRPIGSCLPSPALQPNSGLPEFGLLMSRPKSETSDFGWRDREGACKKIHACKLTPSPTLPRKREREHTEFAALICSNVTKLTSPNLSRNNAPSPRRPAGGVAGAGGGGTHVHLPPRRCRRARHQGGTAGGRLCALLRQARRAARSNSGEPYRHSHYTSGSRVPSPVYGGGTGRGHAKRLMRASSAPPPPPPPPPRGGGRGRARGGREAADRR